MTETTSQARRRELLEAIRAAPGDWTTGQVRKLYEANGWGPNRSVARADLRHLTEDGLLLEIGAENARSYRLNAARDPRLGHGWQTPADALNRAKHRPRRR
ncbi:hypothetical protein [Streptomyces canus]|uniref:hypothetical protein n=1 Tax=Streptomyces canus TaxID=58343 RepID=UPI00386E8A91|nr:hypothetical protein OH824_17670 [Streptomyces canus]